MKTLCLTLGHNSSAIMIEDGHVLCGYEEERLSLIKSDSSFPRKAIEQCLRFEGEHVDEIMIGHWELTGDVTKMKPKHFDAQYLATRFPKANILSVNSEFTHHDSHAFSAMAFVGDDFPENNTLLIVCDGFGTMGEHLSVYRVINKVPVLQRRFFGFGTSLGLMFQYATGYLGMKQNQDEYKLLAFEAHIEEFSAYFDKTKLQKQIRVFAEQMIEDMFSSKIMAATDPMLSVSALPQVAIDLSNRLDGVLKLCGLFDSLDESAPSMMSAKRSVISYFVQSVLERVMSAVLSEWAPTNLILVGGVFYNVKLNHTLAQKVSGLTSVMPLAGDQGAALGIYHRMNKLNWPNHLYWGKRLVGEIQQYQSDTLLVVPTKSLMLELAHETIRRNGFVNIVQGAMEFGPRALGHTSTLAIATDLEVARTINRINNRTNEMPFAPVVHPDHQDALFEDMGAIHRSTDYMIITRDYRPGLGGYYRGAAHYDVDRDVFTGRPQVSNDWMISTLCKFNEGALINTSFNFHGVPIVYSANDIYETHRKESEIAEMIGCNPPVTIVLEK